MKSFIPSKAKELALTILQIGNVPFFRGGTGVGKSAVVRDTCKRSQDC
jgi:MoxR-like ATPase